MTKFIPQKAKPLVTANSDSLWKKACEVIPGGCQTFSKMPYQHVAGVSPKLLSRGSGSRSWDVDGNEYIDYMMSLGPNILGYADEKINKAAFEGAKLGVVSSLGHPLETKLAEKLVSIIPCAEMVRFGKNGSDITSAAIRAARSYTGRDKILVCGYHGWHDWYIGSTSRNLGVPKEVQNLTLNFKYNDISSLKNAFKRNPGEIAAVMMEPVAFIEPEDGFLEQVKLIAHENNALLIFDEVITGFRINIGGAQTHFNVIPDLACFGKAMGNGYPMCALVGKAEIMSVFEEAFFSGTFAAELVSISASIATITAIEERGTLEHINRLGLRLKDGYNNIANSLGLTHVTEMIGYGWWPEYLFYDEYGNVCLQRQSLFQQEIVRRGILTRAGIFLCGAHQISDIDKTLEVFQEALIVVGAAIEADKVLEWLDGDILEPVIRSK
jgi:glutamate-1-semialdehyde aminotransferase